MSIATPGKRKRGNIANVAQQLLKDGHIKHVGAVQRVDWIRNVPAFEKIRIGYAKRLAEMAGGKVSFGGFVESPTEDLSQFLKKLRDQTTNKRQRRDSEEQEAESSERNDKQQLLANDILEHFLPPSNAYPMAASTGYLCLLPALGGSRELVVIVIMRAGYICLQEVLYTRHLLDGFRKSNPSQEGSSTSPNIPIHVYGISWPAIEADLTADERNTKCCLWDIRKHIEEMKRDYPSNVHLLEVA